MWSPWDREREGAIFVRAGEEEEASLLRRRRVYWWWLVWMEVWLPRQEAGGELLRRRREISVSGGRTFTRGIAPGWGRPQDPRDTFV